MVAEELENDLPPEALPAGVVLTGGGALLDGILPMAERALGMHARLGYPQKVRTQYDRVSSPIYATAVGLIHYAHRLVSSGEFADGRRAPAGFTAGRVKQWLQGVF